MKERLEIATHLLGLMNASWNTQLTMKYVAEALDIADMLIEIEANKLRCANVKCAHLIRDHAKGACRNKTVDCFCQSFSRPVEEKPEEKVKTAK